MVSMAKKTKAVYDVVTTYGMHREMIFTLQSGTFKNYIEAVNTRTGEYHQIPYKKEYYGDFIYKCEFFIAQHFGEHLSYYLRKSYQEGEE